MNYVHQPLAPTNGNGKVTTSAACNTAKQAENVVLQVLGKLVTGWHGGTLLESHLCCPRLRARNPGISVRAKLCGMEEAGASLPLSKHWGTAAIAL